MCSERVVFYCHQEALAAFMIAIGLTPRWSQRRLPLELMDGLSYTTIIEPAEPLVSRRGSALGR